MQGNRSQTEVTKRGKGERGTGKRIGKTVKIQIQPELNPVYDTVTRKRERQPLSMIQGTDFPG